MRLSSSTIAGLISVFALAAADAATAKDIAPASSVFADPAAIHRYKTIMAEVIRRHTPNRATIGQGRATCFFHVGKDGAISVVEATGSSPAHAALARRIIESLRAPPPPGGPFDAEQSFHFN
ncbi:hypothetical protein [Methylosinus sp. LW4]|uniref:hypothetical protein n=1 Tax=Methylosinus sp. LW4 TaxID=136993 RepID=UPI00037FD66D|nr:hypothetical protein [Methylosinus sp. LW4]